MTGALASVREVELRARGSCLSAYGFRYLRDVAALCPGCGHAFDRIDRLDEVVGAEYFVHLTIDYVAKEHRQRATFCRDGCQIRYRLEHP